MSIIVRTTRFSNVIKAFLAAYPNSIILLDNNTQNDDMETWCTNQNLLNARDFSLQHDDVELLGYHDNPKEIWADDSVEPLLQKLQDEKMVRFTKSQPKQSMIEKILRAFRVG